VSDLLAGQSKAQWQGAHVIIDGMIGEDVGAPKEGYLKPGRDRRSLLSALSARAQRMDA